MTRPPERLVPSAFAADADEVARGMLGAVLVRIIDGVRVSGRVVETEAYMGPADKAAHSINWRRTPRTEPMFGPPGTAYVFLTYGMHHCFNVACREAGFPSAVLVRAIEPIDGIDIMRDRRGSVARRDRDLCSGPGKLCSAMDIDRSLTGVDLCRHEAVWLEHGTPPRRIDRGPRIGVDYAEEWADAPLRFVDADSRHLSRPLRGVNRPTGTRSPGAGQHKPA